MVPQSGKRYGETTQAVQLAQGLDLQRARRIPSFQRFVEKVARVA